MRLDDEKMLQTLFWASTLSFLPAIYFYYVGEEAIFPISSLEMHHSHSLLVQVMYGANVRHNPLFNWLIMLFSGIFGWNHVLEVTRAITIFSTMGSSLVLYGLAFHHTRDRHFSLFSSVVYLGLFDVAFYRGWLAYVDPLFSFFVFSSIALLWIASRRENFGILITALVCLELAFLSKALTAYVFYGISALVLLRQHRKFLLGLPSILLHALFFLFPFAWFSLLPASGQGQRMFGEILSKLSFGEGYLAELAGFPLELLLRLSPAALLAAWFLFRKKEKLPAEFRLAAQIAVYNFLPYWIAPQSSVRYLMPIYPFFALFMSWVLWKEGRALTLKVVGAFLAFKLLFMLFLFPIYQHEYRGKNYLDAAREIAKETKGYPLYVTDVSASGLSVAGYLDALRWPRTPVAFPPERWDSGYVIAYDENPSIGKTVKTYKLGGDSLYLLCRGNACMRTGASE